MPSSRALSVMRVVVVCGVLLWLKFDHAAPPGDATARASLAVSSSEALRSENLRLRRAVAYLTLLQRQCAETAPPDLRAGEPGPDPAEAAQAEPAAQLGQGQLEPVLLQIGDLVEIAPGGPMTPITY